MRGKEAAWTFGGAGGASHHRKPHTQPHTQRTYCSTAFLVLRSLGAEGRRNQRALKHTAPSHALGHRGAFRNRLKPVLQYGLGPAELCPHPKTLPLCPPLQQRRAAQDSLPPSPGTRLSFTLSRSCFPPACARFSPPGAARGSRGCPGLRGFPRRSRRRARG